MIIRMQRFNVLFLRERNAIFLLTAKNLKAQFIKKWKTLITLCCKTLSLARILKALPDVMFMNCLCALSAKLLLMLFVTVLT